MTTVKWTPVDNNMISSDWSLILNVDDDYDLLPTCRRVMSWKNKSLLENIPDTTQHSLLGVFCWLWMAEIANQILRIGDH